ncbi:MFS transporter [Paenibacillus hexagrammi]|uniref:MFS transporter n=1 Tax=Paenibacillus hexagrammi TaxID=2908839 RepID=A0ABY3SHL9_9BACL|nr:MFS transporter [Paenibacillus sp. YPD9-1]UJF33446.1 MFS transporter [Paenibacillus sp. YPD9-1]
MLGLSNQTEGQTVALSKWASKPIWRNRPFVCIFASHCVSLLGNAFHSIALNLWVLQSTGSAKLMSVVLIATLIVQMLFGTLAGTIADRVDRRVLMYLSDISRFLLVAGMALSMLIPGTSFYVILLLTVLTSTAGLFYSPAFQASLVHLVAREQIQQASGAMVIADNVIRISGFALGGIAVAVYGGVFALSLDAVSYLVSALLLFAGGAFPSKPSGTQQQATTFKEDFFFGLSFIWKEPMVRAALLLLPLLFMFFLSALMLTQVMAVQVWLASPFIFGLIEACIPLGYVLGSGFIMIAGNRLKHRGIWILLSVVMLGPVYVLLSQTGSGGGRYRLF